MNENRKLQIIIIISLLTLLGGAVFSVYKVSAATSSSVTATITATICGDETAGGSEDCDTDDLNEETCVSQGYSGGGILDCTLACDFDFSGCSSGAVSPPGGGGGGGGGSPILPSQATVVFTGKAYPKSIVTILKDAQIVVSTVAGDNANFQARAGNLSAGNYIFSVYSEDKEGRRSTLLTFPVSVSSGSTASITGIFIAPTIDVDKREVRRGDNIAILGQSAPQADIIIAVNSEEEFFAKTISNEDGIYLYNFDTSILEYGSHYTRSKASIGNQLISGFSSSINFKVGTKTVIKEKLEDLKGDSNGDNRVNLVDFSITAYWYKRPSPPARVDVNSDGKVDLIDFSIMAYYWTG